MTTQIDLLRQQLNNLHTDKNEIIETLVQKITMQQNQIEELISIKEDQNLLSIDLKELMNNGLLFQNFSSHKKYLLLDVSQLGPEDQFIHQKVVKIARNDVETWDNAILIKLKDKLNHTNSYCEMLLNDLQVMDEKVDKLKRELQSKKEEEAKISIRKVETPKKQVNVQREEKIHEPKVQKQENQKKENNLSSPNNDVALKKRDWSNLFSVLESNTDKHQQPSNKGVSDFNLKSKAEEDSQPSHQNIQSASMNSINGQKGSPQKIQLQSKGEIKKQVNEKFEEKERQKASKPHPKILYFRR